MQRRIVRQVWSRAGDRCEYCRVPSSFYRTPYQHIRLRQHAGSDELENLALACLHCNVHKGTNIAGIDSETASRTRLYHPRTDFWEEQFQWNGALLEGRTAIGRTTIIVLSINHPLSVAVRAALLDEGHAL